MEKRNEYMEDIETNLLEYNTKLVEIKTEAAIQDDVKIYFLNRKLLKKTV